MIYIVCNNTHTEAQVNKESSREREKARERERYLSAGDFRGERSEWVFDLRLREGVAIEIGLLLWIESDGCNRQTETRRSSSGADEQILNVLHMMLLKPFLTLAGFMTLRFMTLPNYLLGVKL